MTAAADSTRADPGSQSIELHLPDGGHVVMSIEDPAARSSGICDDLVQVLVRAEGTERDVERTIRAEAAVLGLDCSSSTMDHSTLIVVRQPNQ